ncbi:MAG: hypothetical protein OXG69_07115 [bacterium]|nr:hypothetical protein [bacterium]
MEPLTGGSAPIQMCLLWGSAGSSVFFQVNFSVRGQAIQQAFSVAEHVGDFLDGVGIDILVRKYLGVVGTLAVRCELAAETLKSSQERNVALNERILLLAHPSSSLLMPFSFGCRSGSSF